MSSEQAGVESRTTLARAPASTPGLPLRRPRAAAPPMVLGPLRGTVLVAEDADDLRQLAVLYLKSFGLAALEAVNGAEAETLALRDQPEVILMDLEMPVLGGLDAAAQLRRAGYRGTIFALTGHPAEAVSAQCLGAGCNDILSKPVSRVQLHAALAGVLQPRAHALTADVI